MVEARGKRTMMMPSLVAMKVQKAGRGEATNDRIQARNGPKPEAQGRRMVKGQSVAGGGGESPASMAVMRALTKGTGAGMVKVEARRHRTMMMPGVAMTAQGTYWVKEGNGL
jgi:hypothetical protein